MEMILFIEETLLSNMGKYITFERSVFRHLFYFSFILFAISTITSFD